jgi:serine/threonine protein kinase
VSSRSDGLVAALTDRYRIERELGAGGMATVYLAEDLKHRRHVALKVLKPELAAVLGADRFVQEITTTAALQHPHILPLFDSGEADGPHGGGEGHLLRGLARTQGRRLMRIRAHRHGTTAHSTASSSWNGRT